MVLWISKHSTLVEQKLKKLQENYSEDESELLLNQGQRMLVF
jgi:hypothetical protein